MTDEQTPSRLNTLWKWCKISMIIVAVLILASYLNMRLYKGQEPDLTLSKHYKAPAHSPNPKLTHCPTHQPGTKQVYWGDFHVHTSYSMDAYSVGTRNGPSEAYAFGQGKPLTLADGKTKLQLKRKLDFMAVTDHAEYFASTTLCFDPKYRNSWFCLFYRNGSRVYGPVRLLAVGVLGSANALAEKPGQPPLCSRKDINCMEAMENTWKHIQDAAQRANKPCKFTTFIGYEWTGTPKGSHWHRNVIFATAQVPKVPYDFINYPTPEALHKALQRGCKKAKGCDVIAIPHNSNWSDGRAFKISKANDKQLALRAKYERLVEIHQIKGNSECLHPFKDDQGDCNFEISINPMSEPFMKGAWYGLRKPPMTKARWNKIRSSYVREALKKGLRAYTRSGKKKRNPLKFGFIASTDTHNATPGATDPENYRGSHGDLDIKPQNTLNEYFFPMNTGGLVAVWAEENTRGSLFAALKRRETYGTSGPRIKVRFFQTWDTAQDPCKANANIHPKTPMGGDITPSPRPGARPRFVVNALMDNTRLARVDIYKATLSKGNISEKLISFHANDKTKGDPSICKSWTDHTFQTHAPTLWYARVLERPTKRWSTLQCEKLKNCKKLPKSNRMVQQRAWTSPIWYLP